ncbi:MAG: PaaI family thioesterase [Bacillota bacterium]|jgi:uncharacterized protein (TIGR00369 family)
MKESVPMCFGCGRDNPIGLKLVFREENDLYVSDFSPLPEHQGYPGMVHGGIICAILDEAMGRLVWSQGCDSFTARLETRFKKPVPIEHPIRVQARQVSQGRAGTLLEARILLENGQVAAEAKGTYLKAKGNTGR